MRCYRHLEQPYHLSVLYIRIAAFWYSPFMEVY
jgi:hypothetical protein